MFLSFGASNKLIHKRKIESKAAPIFPTDKKYIIAKKEIIAIAFAIRENKNRPKNINKTNITVCILFISS
jgi:hypothetical protein